MLSLDSLLSMMQLYPGGECPYIAGQSETIRALRCPGLPNVLHAGLMERGFRHSGDIFYVPECEGCKKCLPMRIDPFAFRPSKKQRHIFNKNKDVEIWIESPELTDEIYDVYRRYMDYQHGDSHQGRSRQDLEDFLFQPLESSVEIQYRLQDRIIGVTIADIIPNCAFSSVYHFFDPAYARRSIGVYSVMAEIILCSTFNTPYYYLGYWVPGCKKMQYKANYRPNQVLIDGKWVENSFSDDRQSCDPCSSTLS